MEQLNGVAAASPPVLLWKGGGRFAQLFKFLAARFLANPDSVLDIERQHAVWQWVRQRRRAMKLKSMNACLKLGQYLRGHDALPSNEELQPYITNIKAGGTPRHCWRQGRRRHRTRGAQGLPLLEPIEPQRLRGGPPRS